MKTADQYSDALRLYDRMVGKGISPNPHVFATLIDKAADYDESVRLLRIAEGLHIDLDEAVYVAVMSNGSYDQAMGIFRLLKSLPGKRTVYPYNTIISRCSSLPDAMIIIDDMRLKGPFPDRATINAALNLRWDQSSDFAPAAALVERAINDGVRLISADIAALIRRAVTSSQVDKGLALLSAARLRQNIDIDNSIMGHASGLGEAMLVFTAALGRGNRPDKHTFYALLRTCQSTVEAFQVLSMMRDAGLRFDARTVDRLIAISPDPTRSRSLRQQVEMSGEKDPEAVIRGLVIIWSRVYERKAWLDRLFPR